MRRPFYRGFRSSTLGPPGRIAPASMLELLEGFDPPTRSLQMTCSSRLSYNSVTRPPVPTDGRYKIVCRFSRRSCSPDAPASDPHGRRKKNGEKHARRQAADLSVPLFFHDTIYITKQLATVPTFENYFSRMPVAASMIVAPPFVILGSSPSHDCA